MKRRLFLAAFLLLTGVAPRAQEAQVLIGLAGPMSGPLADAGKSMAAGASLAVKDINAKGGFNGAPATLVVENDEAGTVQARRAAEALAARKVRIVIGHHTSAPTSAAAEIYARNGVLLIAPSATSPALPGSRSAHFLRLAPREDAQAIFAARVLVEEYPRGELAIVHDGGTLSRILAAAAADAIARARGQEARVREIAQGAQAMQQAAALAEALARETPAAVFYAGGPAAGAAFLKAFRQSGAKTPVVASDALASAEFAAIAGDALDGLRMVAAAAPEESAREIAARLRNEGAKDIRLALATYASVQIVAEAARRVKSFEPEKLGQAMRGSAATATAIGSIGFDETGERRELPFMIVRWQRAADGKFLFAPE